MATYTFTSITTAQAGAYNSATDDLQFTGVTGASANNIVVTGTYTIRIVSTDVRLTLGPGAQGEVITMPDGSRLALPSTAAVTVTGGSGDDHLYGSSSGDLLLGNVGNDHLEAGAGADTLTGGIGMDTLSGGGGADVFTFAPGDSSTTATFADVITDWNPGARISFTGSQMNGAYAEETGNAVNAASLANALIAAGTADVVAVQAGLDVLIFADTRNNNGAADDVIVLAGRTLADIAAENILGLLPPPPPPTPELIGTSGPDTLNGGATADSISGAGGDDVLNGGAGNDTIVGGDGADTLNGGPGSDRLTGGAGGDLFVIDPGDSLPSLGADFILDVDAADRIMFAGGTLRGDLVVQSELTFDRGLAFANTLIGDGLANFVLMRTNDGTFLFVDSNNDDGVADQAVRIQVQNGHTFSAANLFATAADTSSNVPPPPTTSTGLRVVMAMGDMDRIQPSDVIGAFVTNATDSNLQIQGTTVRVGVSGFGFTYVNNRLVGGTATGFVYNIESPGLGSVVTFFASGVNFPAASLGPWVAANARDEALSTILAGSDRIEGDFDRPDLIRAYAGNDLIRGGGGGDTIYGGAGDDLIYAVSEQRLSAHSTYLRGDEGNDYIVGSNGFDDINGNMGNDTGIGGAGDDWVVGGKDNDLLFGQSGNDLVYGNLGNDTCEGGDGNDTVRGGQNDDIVRGGAGNDFISGDLGNDTMTGGVGADIFNTFAETGLDRVTDFSAAQGDRVQLAPGTQYTVAQVGADTVITMSGGQMVLVGVQASLLPAGWIFGA